MRTHAEQDLALRELGRLRLNPQEYVKELLLLALGRCYELLLESELEIQCQLFGGQMLVTLTVPSDWDRCGHNQKTLHSVIGAVRIKVPRLRSFGYRPQLIKQNQRRIDGTELLVLQLCSFDLRQGDPFDLKQRFLQLFGPRYRKFSAEQLQKFYCVVVKDLGQLQLRQLSERYVAVIGARFDLGLGSINVVPGIAPIYLTAGINTQGDFELLELYQPSHLAIPKELAQGMLERLYARGVKDIILLIGPELSFDYDQVHALFPYTTIC